MGKNWFGILLVATGFFYSCVNNEKFNPKSQLQSDTLSIGKYIRDNQIAATKTPGGVWYFLTDTANGIYPVLSDSVIISYSAWTIPPGTEPLSKSTAFKKLLSTAISGLQIALPHFPTGSSGNVYVPSGLAYGVTGNDSIPPNTNLLFNIRISSAYGNRFKSDTAIINDYVNDIAGPLLLKKIVVKEDPSSGIRYWYDSLYSNSPSIYPSSTIDVTYKAWILKADKPFDSVVVAKSLKLETTITAWKIIIPYITVGTTVTMYVPSGYGYGSFSDSTATIPANSNLVYQVKLINVH